MGKDTSLKNNEEIILHLEELIPSLIAEIIGKEDYACLLGRELLRIIIRDSTNADNIDTIVRSSVKHNKDVEKDEQFIYIDTEMALFATYNSNTSDSTLVYIMRELNKFILDKDQSIRDFSGRYKDSKEIYSQSLAELLRR